MADEKNFENRLKKWLESEGVYPAGTPMQEQQIAPCGWFFKVWGGGFQKSGIPDLLLCVSGLFIAIELKGSGGRPSDLQKLNLADINHAGGLGLILYPEGFEQFKKILKGVKQCKSVTAELNVLISANTNTNCVMWTG